MKILLAKLLVASLLFFQAASWAEDSSGRIVGVIDGDTVDLLTDNKTLIRVRLSGIDAPEKKQPFGSVSKKALSDLAFDRRVVVVGSKNDRYGRLIGKVLVSGVDANLRMVQLGLAWHYKKYQNEQVVDDRLRYADAELKAREKRVGLWADKEPIAPWEFRHHKKGAQLNPPKVVWQEAPRFEGGSARGLSTFEDVDLSGYTMNFNLIQADRRRLPAEPA